MSNLGTIIADFTVQLITQLDIGGTTATIKSNVDDDGVTLPNGKYFFTLDGANSQKEHIYCTLTGTALSIIQSVSRQGTKTTGAARQHRVGASVSITDFAHISFINKMLQGQVLLDSTTPIGYDANPAVTDFNQLATCQYVLDHVTGGTVSINRTVVAGTAGETIAAGNLVYLKSDGLWYKTDADDFTTLYRTLIGVAQGAGTVSVLITNGILIKGFDTTNTGLVVGTKYYVSNTAGAISSSVGTFTRAIGVAKDSTGIYFDTDFDNILISQGVYSSQNKLISQDNVYDSATDQTQATQNGTVEFGMANTTTNKNKIQQSFIPTKTKIRGVNLYKIANTGTYTGDVTVALYADSAGSPSGSALATVTIANATYNALAVGEFEADFSAEYSMTVGTTYWIQIIASTADNSNHPNLGTNTGGGYTSGSVKYWNTTDAYVAVANIDLYFKTLQGIVSQVIQSNTSGKVPSIFGIDIQTFTSSGTWTMPTGAKSIMVEAIGGGGGGGGNTAGVSNVAGGAGGGGGYSQVIMPASLISSPVTIIINNGGAGGIGRNPGEVGGTSTFGTYLTAYGGGGGAQDNNDAGRGGGGGGMGGAGATANTSVGGAGGFPENRAADTAGYFGGAGGRTTNGAGDSSFYGGGGGGRSAAGGTSVFGGGGGGSDGGAGGVSKFGGNGGAGATYNTPTNTGANGTDGTAPGGGGGGSATGVGQTARNGGAGAKGQIVVTTYY